MSDNKTNKDNGLDKGKIALPIITPEKMSKIMLSDKNLQLEVYLNILASLLVEARIATKKEIQNKFELKMKTMEDQLTELLKKGEKDFQLKKDQAVQELLMKLPPKGSA